MILAKPVIALLHNTKLNRYHPVMFVPASAPGGKHLSRYRSLAHHTEGSESREEALKDADGRVADFCREKLGEPHLCFARDFPWDGEGIPAMVVFFDQVNGDTVPVLW